MRKLLLLGLIFSLLIPFNASSAQDETPPLYVALIWHQHQPVYFKDPDTGIYARPWVRVHATKDYLDMVTMLDDYPDVKATFNLTPSLIRQLDDISAGAKDAYWVLSEKSAADLTDDDKAFILERFFDANRKIIERFPRYQELLDMRDGGIAYSESDFRDLQILFNLAWTDPDWLAEAPLNELVAKGRDYAESDKVILFDEHLRLTQAVIPAHAERQASGQIEITMTPYAHPILPLLIDSDVAAVAMPDATLPTRFSYPEDALAQVQRGVTFYEEHFGLAPRGMWPAEGSVSPAIIEMVADANIQWIATDENVLARSLPEIGDFTRNSADTVQQADQLYRPYQLTGEDGGQVAVLFRDHILSDRVGFEYSGTPGQQAADDMLARLNAIQAQLAAEGASGPNLVTILLDGENAWEHYDNDGKEFLHAMYRGLSDAPNLITVTPSEYLAMTEAPRPLENLWPGSWVTPDFATWIGEWEENEGWEYLRQTREAVETALPNLSPEVQEQVMDLMLIAEGSDWFWWYGADQNSGRDEDFDLQFRDYLGQIYGLIGVEAPETIAAPIIPAVPQAPDSDAKGPLTVNLDDTLAADEWRDAAVYNLTNEGGLVGVVRYGFDGDNLLLRLDTQGNPRGGVYSLYVRGVESRQAGAFPQESDIPLGFGATRGLQLHFENGNPIVSQLIPNAEGGGWRPFGRVLNAVAVHDDVIELRVPLATFFPNARTGDPILFRLEVIDGMGESSILPPNGPIAAVIPDRGLENLILQAADPAGDDNGPGTYIYPTDPVFEAGAYDLAGFAVGSDVESVIFQVALNGPLNNTWGAPNGLGILTLDIYIDSDGPGNGARVLLPGRNAALTPEFAWDRAIFAEGWEPDIFVPTDSGPNSIGASALTITTDPASSTITIRVARGALPEGDPATWAYAVTVAGQEGYPAAGVLRIRDIRPEAEQYRFGGGTGNLNETRLIDILWPEGAEPTQAELLGNYVPASADLDSLGPDDFPQVPMIRGE